METDLVGQRFHSLVVESDTKRFNNGRLWQCRCDCGNLCITKTAYLNAGLKKHCGCQSYKTGAQSRRWKGYGEIGAGLWFDFQRGAKARGYDFTITIEEAWKMFLKQDRKCALSGVNIEFGHSKKERTASLDRIDSKKPYNLDNIQWVHKDVNFMKQDLPENIFLDWIQKIGKHNQLWTS